MASDERRLGGLLLPRCMWRRGVPVPGARQQRRVAPSTAVPVGDAFSSVIMTISATELLAPGRPIQALASDPEPYDSDEGSLSAVDRVARRANVANNFFDVAKSFSHVANCHPCNIQRTMLRVCCERVPSMLRTRLRATSKHQASFFPLPHMLRPCCDYVATML
jgi:hypothetical protein